MKRLLSRLLLFLSPVWLLASCNLLNGDSEDTDPSFGDFSLQFEFDRYQAVVLPGKEVRIGYTLQVYGVQNANDANIRCSIGSYDQSLYQAELQTESSTSGTLVIKGIGAEAGWAESEILLKASSSLGYETYASVLLAHFNYEIVNSPEGDAYILPAAGGTTEIVLQCNAEHLASLRTSDSWIRYSPSESYVETIDALASVYVHHYVLRVEAHTQGSDPREGSVEFSVGDIPFFSAPVRQEVDFAADGREMILRVRASAANARTVYLPLDDIVACTVDWGDGSREQFERRYTYDNPISHVYAEAGEYKVTIRGQVNAVTSFGMPSGALDNCILAVEQWGNLGAEEIVLRDITTLERIAPDTEGAFAKIRNFDRTFLGCTGLTELPEGLFARAESAAIFEATFYECTGLTKLPEGLFEGANPITFDTTFGRCTSLTELPGGLFRGCSHASTFHRTFEECTGLTSLPGRLFIPCPMATTFQATFYNCTGLAALPEGLFAGNPEAVSFGGETDYHNGAGREDRGLFTNCTALTEIPEGLFAFNSKVTDLSMAFLGCSGIREIPAGLFAALPELENLEYVFEGCTQIEEIPSGLFDNNPLLQEMYSAFRGCSSLRRLPTDLFDNNRLIRSFGYTFLGCEALEGESPYTEIGGRKYHLYERSENSVEFTPPDGYGCFGGCTKLSDYEEIPEAWR